MGNVPTILTFILTMASCFTAMAQSRNVTALALAKPVTSYERPIQLYGRLYKDVMSADSLFGPNKLLSESKSFADAVPRYDANTILADYCRMDTVNLATFITSHFILPTPIEKKFAEKTNIHTTIRELWHFLSCPADTVEPGTRIIMRHPYFVPGGRFREMYYWDSYFSMLGMLADNEHDLVLSMLENFSDCIRQFGFIPNGMRTYYLGRSQPPFFSFMVEDAAVKYGDSILVHYLPDMVAEYQFWMKGADAISESHPCSLRVVRMPEGEILNRYYDNYNTPREEAWRNDMEQAELLREKNPQADIQQLYRNLRAAAESGYDFSSRWMADGRNLYTIQTTDIVPVDLNCLLVHLEMTIARGYRLTGDKTSATRFANAAKMRVKAIREYMWSAGEGFFTDYLLSSRQQSPQLSLAGAYPLYCGVATRQQALRTEKTIKEKFLKKGGVVTTLAHTGQQWDAPNGWAPLQWIVYKGLQHYGRRATAGTLRKRWMETCSKVFSKTGKLLEKYDVERQDLTGGGEYENQTGFGWTNGVYRAMEKDP